MRSDQLHLTRLVAILTLAILGLAWGLVGLAVLLGDGASLKGNLLVIAVFASPVALFLCALAFGKIQFVHESDEDDWEDDWDADLNATSGPSVNTNGLPMIGAVDVSGQSYGSPRD